PFIPVFSSKTLTQSLFANGDSPVPDGFTSVSSGNSKGKSSSGIAVVVPSSQWIIGIGSPQYLCLENNQSRSRYVTSFVPLLFSSSHSIILFIAASSFRPLRKPEFTCFPSPIYGSFEISPPETTSTIGKSKAVANS